MLRGWLGIAALLAGPAMAQVPGEGGDDDLGSPGADVPPGSLTDGYAWRLVSPLRLGEATGLAVAADDRDVVLAVGRDGGAWLSRDGGAAWASVLPPPRARLSDDEDRLQDVQAYLEDSVQQASADDLTGTLDPEGYSEAALADQLQAELDGVASQVAGEFEADMVSQGWLFNTEARAGAGVPAVAITRGHQDLWVARQDGLWLSEDLGARWVQVLEVATRALVYDAGRGLWVAGTADGFRYAADPRRFMDVDDGTEGMDVLDLQAAGEGLYAGTDDGLWWAADAQSWIPVGPTSGRVPTVLPDPDWDLGLWLSQEGVVVRSDDRGRTFRDPLSAPLQGTRDLLWLGPGRLLSATADGPWESLDGGVTWAPLPAGLVEPVTYALALGTHGPLLAGAGGVFALRPVSGASPVSIAPFDPPAPWIPTYDLVMASTHRTGLVGDPSSAGVRRLSSVLPQIRVEFRFDQRADLSFRSSSGSSRKAQGIVNGTVRLMWTPDGRKTSTDLAPFVFDGTVMLGAGDDRSMVGARVGRRGMRYRQNLSDLVIQLTSARAELQQRRPSLAHAPLPEQVEYALRIREIDARLDGLTDGYVTSYQLSRLEGDLP